MTQKQGKMPAKAVPLAKASTATRGAGGLMPEATGLWQKMGLSTE